MVTIEEEVALAEVFQDKEGVIGITVATGTMDLGVVVEEAIMVLVPGRVLLAEMVATIMVFLIILNV